VRRLNRVPLLIAGILLLMILGAVTYTYQMRLADTRRKAAEAQTRAEPAGLGDLFPDAPRDGLIPAAQPVLPPTAIRPAPPADPPAENRDIRPLEDDWERYRQAQLRLAEARNAKLLQALGAPSKIQATLPKPSVIPDQAAPDSRAPQGGPGDGQLPSLYAAASALRRLQGGEETFEEINRAAEKTAFLGDRAPQSAAANYLSGGRVAPVSPYELKAGAVIPAVMVGGVNSDLPGQILGQVTENVYDTATGRFILIPQGSKLVGTYDNAVTTGQNRVLVAWTRIIYPDASSIDLGKMPGTDANGFAGFKDQVDTHFWPALGNAILMSIFSAGIQMSQGASNSSDDGLTAGQSIAAGLGQQLAQFGQESGRRNSRVQPTLEIRPGYKFAVIVTKDVVIRPWRRSQ
jgi:type IV secretion system protein VirB10